MHALLTSWEVSTIKDVFSSVDEGYTGFYEFDEVGGGFKELPDSRLESIALLSRGNMLHFQKPVFISVTVIDSHSCLNSFVKLVLQQLIDSFHPSVASFRFWFIRLKWAFNGWNMTTSSGWKRCVWWQAVHVNVFSSAQVD